MADPDIRRVGKKHKKHKKEHTEFQGYRLPGFLPERVPMPEEPDEMKVVLRLPRPMENHNGKLRFAPQAAQRHRDNRHSGGKHHAPRELMVSIPLAVLDQSTEQEDEEEEAVVPTAQSDWSASTAERHHKHKKHKKHKKHHHRDSTHSEEVKGGQQAPPTASPMTVAPLRIHVPKPVESKVPSKHKSHHVDSESLFEGRGLAQEGGVLSGKHMHTYTHKHHHKHKEKRHEHSRHKATHQTGSELHVSGEEVNEQGQRAINIAPLRIPGGKPTSFLINEERKKKKKMATDSIGEELPVEDRQASSLDAHKHHKKKKKKHHKHFKHQTDSEVSPSVVRVSDADSEDIRGGNLATPLSSENLSHSSRTHIQQRQVTTPPDKTMSNQKTPSSRDSDLSYSGSGRKESRRTSHESSEVPFLTSATREPQRSSLDESLSRIPLRRASRDSRTAKSHSQDTQPPASKRMKMDSVQSSPSPLLDTKIDITETRNMDTSDLRFQHTPSPTIDTQLMTSSRQLQVSSDPLLIRSTTTSHSVGSVATPPVATPPAVTKPAVEARRPSTGEKTYKSVMAPPSPATSTAETKTPQVRLSKDTLQLFLKNLHHLIQRRDPEGIFAEPVTDDIAPGYSALIPIPMDLTTMSTKIDMGQYSSVGEFKSDFILMCNNAMTYNAPETVYYGSAKRLLTTGLQLIAKETSLRPDIRHGTTAPIASRSVSPAPILLDSRIPTPPVNIKVDYSSPFLCRFDLSILRGAAATTSSVGIGLIGGALVSEQTDHVSVDVGGVSEVPNQSHLTKVVVGVEEEEREGSEGEVEDVLASAVAPESPEEILMQVEEAAEAMKENLDTNRPHVKFSFLNQDESGKTMLNVLNPDTGTIDYSNPLDITTLSDYVRMGNNAATVLKTELPLMRATPVSYLMYGPFGSFAPAYDSSFATLSKMDSDLLLQSYGSELGVSYAHSLQQFVKGAGSYVTEMADAVLNGLTSGRHSKLMTKFKEFEEKERKLREGSAESSVGGAKDSMGGAKDGEQKRSSQEREGTANGEREHEGERGRKEIGKEEDGKTPPTSEQTLPTLGQTPPTGEETPPTLEDSHGSSDFSSGSDSKKEIVANENSRDSTHKEGDREGERERGEREREGGREREGERERERERGEGILASLETEDIPTTNTVHSVSDGSSESNVVSERKPHLSSLSGEATVGPPDQVSLEGSSTPGDEGEERKREEEEGERLEERGDGERTMDIASLGEMAEEKEGERERGERKINIGGLDQMEEEEGREGEGLKEEDGERKADIASGKMEEEEGLMEGGDGERKMAAITSRLGLEDEMEEGEGEGEEVGSTTSGGSDEEGESSDDSSSSGSSRESSPEHMDDDQPLQDLTEGSGHTELDGIESQLAHTSNLIGRLHDEQRERLSQGALGQDEGRLTLPVPTEEEMRIASDLRAGLVQLTAQACPRDLVSVPALHDAMGITLETVTTQDQPLTQREEEHSQTVQTTALQSEPNDNNLL